MPYFWLCDIKRCFLSGAMSFWLTSVVLETTEMKSARYSCWCWAGLDWFQLSYKSCPVKSIFFVLPSWVLLILDNLSARKAYVALPATVTPINALKWRLSQSIKWNYVSSKKKKLSPGTPGLINSAGETLWCINKEITAGILTVPRYNISCERVMILELNFKRAILNMQSG